MLQKLNKLLVICECGKLQPSIPAKSFRITNPLPDVKHVFSIYKMIRQAFTYLLRSISFREIGQ